MHIVILTQDSDASGNGSRAAAKFANAEKSERDVQGTAFDPSGKQQIRNV